MSPLRLVLIIKCDCGVASSGLTSLPHASTHKVGLSYSFCPSLHLSVSLSVLVPKNWRMQVQLWHLETQQKQSPIGKSRWLFSATSQYWAYASTSFDFTRVLSYWWHISRGGTDSMKSQMHIPKPKCRQQKHTPGMAMLKLCGYLSLLDWHIHQL